MRLDCLSKSVKVPQPIEVARCSFDKGKFPILAVAVFALLLWESRTGGYFTRPPGAQEIRPSLSTSRDNLSTSRGYLSASEGLWVTLQNLNSINKSCSKNERPRSWIKKLPPILLMPCCCTCYLSEVSCAPTQTAVKLVLTPFLRYDIKLCIFLKTTGSYSDKWAVEPINYFKVRLEGNADTSATQRNVKTVTFTYGGLTTSGLVCS